MGVGFGHRRIWKTAGFLAAAGLIMPLIAGGDDTFNPVYYPILHVARTTSSIEIDGDLKDPGWKGAARADNFAEHNPGDQTKPAVETVAFMTYDDNNIYVSMVCYDNPAEIRASLCERDRVFSDDNICLLIDTYGDAAWAYEFNVNPYGIQGDLLWSRNYGEDSRYDLIWESAGKITDSGYQVEIAIPFSSLRFPSKDKQIWKVDFWRNHPRETRYQYSWAAYDRDEPCWPCKWGTVTGIENVVPGRGIEILPSFIGYQTGARNGQMEFDNDNPDGRLSLGAKYALTSNITAEATFNPDFSQIETDLAQIDVNTTAALSFPEKRPFFQEGSDLFNTYFNPVYTRAINDPDFAAKVTARMNRTSFAFLSAHDENTPVIMPFEDFSAGFLAGKSYSNIVRARQTFGEDSEIGMLASNRFLEGGGSGTLLSADGALRLTKQFRFQWQAIGTYTDEPDDTALTSGLNEWHFYDEHTAGYDGESFWGHAYYSALLRETRNSFTRLSFSERSPTFRADIGYEPINNRRTALFYTQYVFRFDEGLVKHIIPNGDAGRKWNFDKEKKDEWISPNLSIELRAAQAQIHARYLYSNEKFSGTQFDNIWVWHICNHYRFGDRLAAGGHIDYGHMIARRVDPLVMGRQLSLSGWFDLKPNDRMLFETWIEYTRSNHVDTDEKLFDTYITGTRLSYQIMRELSLRLFVQYDDDEELWDIDPLLTYRLNAFSVLYFGSTIVYEKFNTWDGGKYERVNRLSSRQFFIKLQYLFQV
ncbi:MAG: carbohydrate binding family 9 domain-containing protein [Candidatus Zixiibacteriota bacterium]|nr:MAG: carbohydrate binding family 9 domain-containing protein [candidate division Zixibacteria bacterium]